MSIPLSTLPNNPPTSAQGVIQNDGGTKDSENDIWNMYLDEVEEDDNRIAKAWKEDGDSVLVFSGLLSATVGAFIIEFYKKLSPDSGDQTVALLGQISQQLANFPGGNYSNAAVQPSPPSASMIWVIAIWLISLLLSLTSALMAIMLQQSARRYVELPKAPSQPNHRARVRWFLFLGMDFYKVRLLVEIAPTLLHLAVYLFFAGLVITFHTINKKVAIAVNVFVGLFGLAYIMLSILPCLDVRCPYRTPMSYILWYPYHISLSFAARCLHWLVKQLHECFVPPNLEGIISSLWRRKLVEWLYSCDKAIRKHWRYIHNSALDGFRENVIDGAINAQEGDHIIFTSLFSVLSLRSGSKLRKLAASVPRHKILDLIRPVESGKIGLRDPLLVLLRSCEAGARTTGPDEDARKRSLLLCLDTIHDISKTPEIPELNFVRANFANIGHMRTLWDDSDTAIRVTSRSICALIARQVGRRDLEGAELRWLQDVTGETSHNADVETRDWMNFKSFVYGVLSNQVEDLSTEDATSFKETLAILLDVRTDPHFDSPPSQYQLSEEVRRIQRDDPEGSHDVVYRLLSIFPFIPLPFPVPIIQPVSLPPLPTSTHGL